MWSFKDFQLQELKRINELGYDNQKGESGILEKYKWFYVVFLDTLTPVFELYIQLRERQEGSDLLEFVFSCL
ncbi:hypothetical protein Taro_029751 [Colocasia esculenta]|uniref:Uncharacterized protein n=1 Tax=Colocasia esculenta TaxID=4460 RepID=A0A843VU54_COLES|nr:hypothetical protein [Colocasia esculenta]